jgi:hypothetical protein
MVEKATPKQHAALSKKEASTKKDNKDRSAQWENDKAGKAQSFSAAASASKQEDSSG